MDFRGADLKGADFRGANLYKADLRGADLSGANLIEANIRDANFYKANLGEVELMEGTLTGVNFTDTSLKIEIDKVNTIYEIRKTDTEVPIKNWKDIKEGIGVEVKYHENAIEYSILEATFEDSEEALRELEKYKTKVSEYSGYYLVEEYHVVEIRRSIEDSVDYTNNEYDYEEMGILDFSKIEVSESLQYIAENNNIAIGEEEELEEIVDEYE